MSDPAPEQQAPSPAWPGGGFAAPGSGGQAPGTPSLPPGYPSQPAYAYQSAYPPVPGSQGQPPTYPAPDYAAGATSSSVPGSTVVLLVLSVVGVVLTGIIGIPSAIIAALAWRQNSADPVAARRRTTVGWIWFAANFALGILALIPFYIWVSNNQ